MLHWPYRGEPESDMPGPSPAAAGLARIRPSAMAGKDAGREIGRTLEREIPARLGRRIAGKIAEETPLGRTGETGTRQRTRIPRADAVDRPGNGLAVEIADPNIPVWLPKL